MPAHSKDRAERIPKTTRAIRPSPKEVKRRPIRIALIRIGTVSCKSSVLVVRMLAFFSRSARVYRPRSKRRTYLEPGSCFGAFMLHLRQEICPDDITRDPGEATTRWRARRRRATPAGGPTAPGPRRWRPDRGP